jgi:hypothetical protein
MGKKSNITRRRLLLAGGATTVFGGGIAYLASRSESSGPTYVPDSSHFSEETTGLGIELAGRPIAGDPDAHLKGRLCSRNWERAAISCNRGPTSETLEVRFRRS